MKYEQEEKPCFEITYNNNIQQQKTPIKTGTRRKPCENHVKHYNNIHKNERIKMKKNTFMYEEQY